MNKLNLPDILLRYSFIFLFAISGFYLLYAIFTPLTIYPLYLVLKIFTQVSLVETTILFASGHTIELITSCIAGSAYFLLLVLNLSTPNIKLNNRIKMLLLAFLSFLTLNILRILLLSFLLVSNSSLFNFTHKLFWYSISTAFVVGIWFIEVKVFNVNSVPFYTDLKTIYSHSSLSRNGRSTQHTHKHNT